MNSCTALAPIWPAEGYTPMTWPAVLQRSAHDRTFGSRAGQIANFVATLSVMGVKTGTIDHNGHTFTLGSVRAFFKRLLEDDRPPRVEECRLCGDVGKIGPGDMCETCFERAW